MWKEANAERYKAVKALYYEKNKERIKKRERERYAKNKERHREVCRAYRKTLSPEKKMWIGSKARAQKLGIPFSIEASDIVIPITCPVLGLKLKTGAGPYCDASAAVDRIIPERGYVPDNIVVISSRANRIKNDASIDELRAVVEYTEFLAMRICQLNQKTKNDKSIH